MKKTLLVLLAAVGMTANVYASEKTVSSRLYLETPTKIQNVLCTNGEMKVVHSMNRYQYEIEDGKLVEYKFSVQNGMIVTVKTIID
jgi:hypothetical protein